MSLEKTIRYFLSIHRSFLSKKSNWNSNETIRILSLSRSRVVWGCAPFFWIYKGNRFFEIREFFWNCPRTYGDRKRMSSNIGSGFPFDPLRVFFIGRGILKNSSGKRRFFSSCGRSDLVASSCGEGSFRIHSQREKTNLAQPLSGKDPKSFEIQKERGDSRGI